MIENLVRFEGLIKPYPSLSFVEYNFSQGGFFTPLVYFLAGHYLDPLDAGEGSPENVTIFGQYLLAVFLPRLPQNWSISFIIFGSNFGSLFWGLGVLWVSFGSLLGPLDSLLGGPKNEKMVNVQRENHFF